MNKRQDSERFKDLGASLGALTTPAPQPLDRPQARPRQRRCITVHFRASPDEHDLVQQAADRMGLTLSSFVRLAVREKLGLV